MYPGHQNGHICNILGAVCARCVSKMNELLEVLRVQFARIGLKISIKKTKSLRLGISEDVNMTLGTKRLNRFAASLTLVV